jgi:hypothetical protein
METISSKEVMLYVVKLRKMTDLAEEKAYSPRPKAKHYHYHYCYCQVRTSVAGGYLR